MRKFTKTVRDADHFLDHLRAAGLDVDGIAVVGGEVYVQGKGAAGAGLVKAVESYTGRNYYEITADRSASAMEGPDPVFFVDRDGVDVVTLTVTKRRGSDGSLVASADPVHLIWHGPRDVFVSKGDTALVNGQATVQVGKSRSTAGGFLEARDPSGDAMTGLAFIRFARPHGKTR